MISKVIIIVDDRSEITSLAAEAIPTIVKDSIFVRVSDLPHDLVDRLYRSVGKSQEPLAACRQ